MKKLLLLSLCFLLLSVRQTYAQGRTVTGTVTAKEDGLPVPGVTVKVRGSQTGTVTGGDGRYVLKNVPENASIVFTFIGYDPLTLPVNGQSNVNAVLTSNNKQLSEVVVTAFGIRREKKALGYSVQEVKGDDLNAAQQSDPLRALAGKVAGANITGSSGTPGAATYIQLRGQNSLTGNNQPLFVIDGVPINNSQNTSSDPLVGAAPTNRAADINPEDVESVTVLKGPSAAALYGIQAANGAIVITTKKGAAGKTQVDFNVGVSFDKVNRLPKLQNQWIKGEKGAIGSYTSSSRYSWGAKADTLKWTGIPNAYDQHGDIVGASNPAGKIAFQPYDNLNNFFRTAPTFNNSVAISGGNDVATYRTSVSNVYQNSIVPEQYYQRTSVGFSGALQMTKKLKASTSLTYTSSNGNLPQQGSNLSGFMLALTRTPISFDNSNGLKDPANNPLSYTLPTGQLNINGYPQRNYRNSGTYDNPYWIINNTPFTTNVNRIFGNIQLDYNIGSGFSALYRLGTDSYQDNRHQYYEIGSGSFNGGQVFDDRYTYRSLNSDLILNYTKKLSDSFQFDGKIGNNFYGRKIDELYTQGDGLVAPGFDNMANASSILSSNPVVPYRSASVFYDLNLSYKSILFLETTGRNDWVSSLPKSKNSFFYPSASLSFVFSELGELKNSSVLSFGKIRFSATQVGNAPDPFRTQTFYVPTAFSDGYTNGIKFPANGTASYALNSLLGNPKLVPEKTTSYELGTQLQFFGNRLGLDATVYYNKGTNQIVAAPIAASSGYNSLTLNSGSLENKGLELQLSGTPIKSTNFSWNSFINFALNRNKVLSLAPGVNQITLNGFTGTVIAELPGQPAGIIYGYGYTRDSQGRIVIDDQNTVGYPLANTNVQEKIGNTNPKFRMGFGNTFTYKKISLYGLVDWKFKGDIWNGTRGSLAAIGTSDLTNNRNTSTVFAGVNGHINSAGALVHYDANGNEVAGAGAVNTKSVLLNQGWYQGNGGGFGNLNEAFIEDGSFIKLREVALSYDFKDLFFGKSSKTVKGFSVGAFARNIIIWTPYKGIDPETSLTGATSAQGIDYFNNPGASSYGVNLKVKF
ncbi:SusC/RagA family TonB-linked outer membrane protein [Mucilaginibacter sp. RS28]|uniref:SusC/RagA family TonB-linked outer membrane protein n=1 Tax=Mucilaginibacter straminoryzae TaxID=2932774 RepID=A0A9X2BBJ4_9SPHI|nr:SusC/RagA family TonB-linked outer membrane protein [Mucilaginibacter straminoryzae]MCJ8211800.1 SusC/RagA family TonB-linked outer membrane protein [Mucilaginibacter straminoryzae]